MKNTILLATATTFVSCRSKWQSMTLPAPAGDKNTLRMDWFTDFDEDLDMPVVRPTLKLNFDIDSYPKDEDTVRIC